MSQIQSVVNAQHGTEQVHQHSDGGQDPPPYVSDLRRKLSSLNRFAFWAFILAVVLWVAAPGAAFLITQVFEYVFQPLVPGAGRPVLTRVAELGSAYQAFAAVAAAMAFIGVLLTMRLQRAEMRMKAEESVVNARQARAQAKQFRKIMHAQRKQMTALTTAVEGFQSAAVSTKDMTEVAVSGFKAHLTDTSRLVESASHSIDKTIASARDFTESSHRTAEQIAGTVQSAANALNSAIESASRLVDEQTKFGREFKDAVEKITASIKEQRESILGINEQQKSLIALQSEVVAKQTLILEKQGKFVEKQVLAVDEQVRFTKAQEYLYQIQNLRAAIGSIVRPSNGSGAPATGVHALLEIWGDNADRLRPKETDHTRDLGAPGNMFTPTELSERERELRGGARGDAIGRMYLGARSAVDSACALACWMQSQPANGVLSAENLQSLRSLVLAAVPVSLRCILVYSAVGGKIERTADIIALRESGMLQNLDDLSGVPPIDRQLCRLVYSKAKAPKP